MIGLFPLIAGLVLWLATTYHTLGIVLTGIGGALIFSQVIFLVSAIRYARRVGKNIRFKAF